MVSVCLPSDALLQHLPSYLGFSYLGPGVSLHGCSSKARCSLPWMRAISSHTLPDLHRGMAPLGPPVPAQPPLLGLGVAPPGRRLGLRRRPGLRRGVAPPSRHPWSQMWGSSQPRLVQWPAAAACQRVAHHLNNNKHLNIPFQSTQPRRGKNKSELQGLTPSSWVCPCGMRRGG